MLRKLIVSTWAVALVAWWIPSEARAQGPMDKRTYFTFSQPIVLPGVTLQAGTYLFRLADPTGNRRVVQVLSEDGKNSYAMLVSIPSQRSDTAGDPEIHFMETPSSTPAAVKTWWYAGESTGYEFIYPKEQAMLLARGGTEPVLTAHAPGVTDELRTVELSRVTPSGDETPVKEEDPLAAATPIGPVQYGTVTPADPLPGLQAVGTSGQAAARTELPQTASMVPLVAFVGMLSLVSGLVVWRWRHLRA